MTAFGKDSVLDKHVKKSCFEARIVQQIRFCLENGWIVTDRLIGLSQVFELRSLLQ